MKLFNDHFQNFKRYNIPKAQLVIADIPYNLGINAYASNSSWYIDGKIANGESDKAGKAFFDTDNDFRVAEFMHFCSKMLIKEPKEVGKAPCMIVFCSFQQMAPLIDLAKRYGFNHYINLTFRKRSSASVLKANMKIVENCEYGLILYRDKLPKFNNEGRMIMSCIDWLYDEKSIPKIHPTQKPTALCTRALNNHRKVKNVLDLFGGSGSTLMACEMHHCNCFTMEIDPKYCDAIISRWENHTGEKAQLLNG